MTGIVFSICTLCGRVTRGALEVRHCVHSLRQGIVHVPGSRSWPRLNTYLGVTLLRRRHFAVSRAIVVSRLHELCTATLSLRGNLSAK